MKLSPISIMLLVVIVLLIAQSFGGYLQVQDYRKAIRRMHSLGNVGMGQRRGRFLNGHIAIIACDNEGVITGAEVMDGIGVWSRFHSVDTFLGEKLVGNSIYTFLDMTKDFDKKRFKRWRGYIRAFEALEVRLTDRELTREQEKYMAEKEAKKRKRMK